MAFDIEGDEWRKADAVALQRELSELRALPRTVLRGVSTRLTMAATTLSQRGQTDEGAAVLHAARLLYVLGCEALEPPAAVCMWCSKRRPGGATPATSEQCGCNVCAQCGHPERYHSPLLSSDAARFRCGYVGCSCVRVER